MEQENFNPSKFFAISGKIGSGKDTLTSLLQIMTSEDSEIVSEFYENPQAVLSSYSGIIETQSRFQNVKFADDVKFIVAKLLGVTVRKLEDRVFKEQQLGEDWWFYRINGKMIPYVDTVDYSDEERTHFEQDLVKLSPRRIFQLIATEGGRAIIHPNIWVNSLFARYVEDENGVMPSWVISDVRFVNEFQACVKRGAVTIRVVRHQLLSDWLKDYAVVLPELEGMEDVKMSDYEFIEFLQDVNSEELTELLDKLTHESETQLDDTEHNYVIHNDGSMEDLVNKLREILIAENVVLTETELETMKFRRGL